MRAALVAAVMLLASCGGGGNDPVATAPAYDKHDVHEMPIWKAPQEG